MSEECLWNEHVLPRPPAPKLEEDILAQWNSESEEPVLSIHCITYNHVDYIEDAINGFLMQKTDFPFEILIYDDASSDGTQDIIRQYEERYPKIISAILMSENQLSQGRKPLSFLSNKSKARFIAFCDGDDFWVDAYKLKKQVDFLEDNPEFSISGHDAVIVNESGEILEYSKLPDNQKRDFSARELTEGKAWILTMSWVYRNVVSEFAPERNMVRNGDYFFTSIIGQYGGCHYHRDIKPAAYRVHSGGVWSVSPPDQKRDDKINTLFWIYSYYKRKGDSELAQVFYSKFKKTVFGNAALIDLIVALAKKLLFLISSK